MYRNILLFALGIVVTVTDTLAAAPLTAAPAPPPPPPPPAPKSAKAAGTATTTASPSVEAAPAPGHFYVSPNGNDAWSGKLPEANAAKTDGPFATLFAAQTATRAEKLRSTVFLRNGTHFLKEPLVFTPADSAMRYMAYPGEKPVVSGGRMVTDWRKGPADVWVAQIPEAANNKWVFRSLRVGNEPQICARFPNIDPRTMTQVNWNYTVYEGPAIGSFGAAITRIHNTNDWVEWKVNVPADGEYRVWLCYSAFSRTNMSGRTSIQAGALTPVPIVNLPDTGSPTTFRWAMAADMILTMGDQGLRWMNVKGGPVNLDAVMVTDDKNLNPGVPGARPAAGRFVQVVQAEAFSAQQAKDMVVPYTRPPAFKDRFNFKAGELKAYPRSPEPEIHMFPGAGKASTVLFLKRLDMASRAALVEPNSNASEEIRLGSRYFVSNALEELDAAGEWYLDRVGGLLYYWPKTPLFVRLGVVAPVLNRLIEFRGDPGANQWVEGMVIRGIEFSDTSYSRDVNILAPADAAILMSGTRNCTIEGSRFVNIGGYALRIDNRSTKNEFLGNEVVNAGQGGVILTGNNATQPKDNLIAGNYLHHLGQVYAHVAGVCGLTASGTRVANNRFEYLPRAAVAFASFDGNTQSRSNVVEYNEILFSNLATVEGGAVEIIGRDKTDSGNVIQYNRITDSVGTGTTLEGKLLSPYLSWGIALDDYASGTVVRGNIVARNDQGGIAIHGGRNNLIENNVFIDGAAHQIHWETRDEFSTGNRFVRNIVYFTNPKADLTFISGTWRPQLLAESNNNIYWHGQGPAFFQTRSLTPAGPFERWQAAGFDKTSVIADPQFIDLVREDYRLKTSAPATKLGFLPIPVEKIGLAGFERSWKRQP